MSDAVAPSWDTVIDPLVVIGPPELRIFGPAVMSIDVTVPPVAPGAEMVMVSVDASVVIVTPVPAVKVSVSS
jgi:hypothetical protein